MTESAALKTCSVARAPHLRLVLFIMEASISHTVRFSRYCHCCPRNTPCREASEGSRHCHASLYSPFGRCHVSLSSSFRFTKSGSLRGWSARHAYRRRLVKPQRNSQTWRSSRKHRGRWHLRWRVPEWHSSRPSCLNSCLCFISVPSHFFNSACAKSVD